MFANNNPGLGIEKVCCQNFIFTNERMEYYSNGNHSEEAAESIGLL